MSQIVSPIVSQCASEPISQLVGQGVAEFMHRMSDAEMSANVSGVVSCGDWRGVVSATFDDIPMVQ